MVCDQDAITEKLVSTIEDSCRVYETESGESGIDVEQMKLYEERERSVAILETEPTCEHLWEAIVIFAGYPFTTAKGLKFSYMVKRNRDGSIGNEIFFSRKEKGITRATVELAFRKALELRTDQEIPAVVSGPKKLGVFGASYLYPLFVRLGVIQQGKPKKQADGNQAK